MAPKNAFIPLAKKISLHLFEKNTEIKNNTKCVVIKMKGIRREVGKKTPKKDKNNLSILWRHMAYFVKLQRNLKCFRS